MSYILVYISKRNQEWTIQRHRKYWTQGTERRQRRTQHRQLTDEQHKPHQEKRS